MRITSWSVAAAVAVAGGVLVFGTTPGIALADVRKAAEKHALVKLKRVETIEMLDGSKVEPAVYVAYADLKKPRYRNDRGPTRTMNDAVEEMFVHVQDYTTGRCLLTTTRMATPAANAPALPPAVRDAVQAMKLPSKEATLRTLKSPPGKDLNAPILEHLRKLEEDPTAVASDDTLDGRETVKYVVTQEEGMTVTLWVLKATKLPVRLEAEMNQPKVPGWKRYHCLDTDFEWDPKLPGFKDVNGVFDTTPQAGYAVTDETEK